MGSRYVLCVVAQLAVACYLSIAVASQASSGEIYLDDDYNQYHDTSSNKELLIETKLPRDEIKKFEEKKNVETAIEEKIESLEDTTRQLAAMMNKDGTLLRHIRGVFVVDRFNSNHNWTLLKQGLVGVLDHSDVAYQQLRKLSDEDEDENQMNYIVEDGSKELLEVLLDYGLYVDTPEPETLDDTILHLAAWYDQAGMVKTLLERGASTSVRNTLGDTPLILAAFRNNMPVLRLLKESGADLDDSNNSERTALHYAAENGFVEVARYLVESGANIKVVDDDMLTPLDLAKKGGHHDIVKLLT